MTRPDRAFLPDRLRPQPARPRRRVRRLRRRALLAAFVAGLAAVAVPQWCYVAVDTRACREVPPQALAGVTDLTGVWVGAVDLEWVRAYLQNWPSVGAVSVRLRLPGTLEIAASPAPSCGSTWVAGGWQQVACDGNLGARLEVPVTPVLSGFDLTDGSLRRGLAVGQRLADAVGGPARSIRMVTPEDYEVRLELAAAGGRAEVHVAPSPTGAEAWWLEAVARGRAPAWADLRRDDRVVVGGMG